MDNREELIKALGGAFAPKAEEAKANDYKFENIVISNQSCSRLLNINPTGLRAREMSNEMVTINALSKFLLGANTPEGRDTDALLRRLCRQSEEDDALFTAIYEIAKEVTDRLRSFSSDSPQRLLLVIYTQNKLKALA